MLSFICSMEAFRVLLFNPRRALSPLSLPYLLSHQGCLCVNPGQLAKGPGGGTYAELAVHPMDKKVLEKKQEGESTRFGCAPRILEKGVCSRAMIKIFHNRAKQFTVLSRFRRSVNSATAPNPADP